MCCASIFRFKDCRARGCCDSSKEEIFHIENLPENERNIPRVVEAWEFKTEKRQFGYA